MSSLLQHRVELANQPQKNGGHRGVNKEEVICRYCNRLLAGSEREALIDS